MQFAFYSGIVLIFLAHPSRKVLGKDLSTTEVCAGQTQPWEDEVICIYFLKINKQDKIIA